MKIAAMILIAGMLSLASDASAFSAFKGRFGKAPDPPTRCLDIWERDPSMTAGLYEIVNEIDGSMVTTTVYCQPGGWTVLVGHPSYEVNGFPFLKEFGGVERQYTGGQLYGKQGGHRVGHCHVPDPSATWLTPFGFKQARVDTRHRVHNATNSIKMGGEYVWHSCGGACGMHQITERNFMQTFQVPDEVGKLRFNMHSCQRWGPSYRGWGHYRYIAVR